MEAWVQIDINTLDTAAIERGIEKCSMDMIVYNKNWPSLFSIYEWKNTQNMLNTHGFSTLRLRRTQDDNTKCKVVSVIPGDEIAKLILILRFSSPMCIVDVKTLQQFEWLAEIGSSLNEPLDTV